MALVEFTETTTKKNKNLNYTFTLWSFLFSEKKLFFLIIFFSLMMLPGLTMFLFIFLDYLKWRCMQVSYFWVLKHWWEGGQEITAENIPKTYPQKPFNLVTSFLCWGENANTFFFFLNDLWVGVQSLTRFSSFQSNKFHYSNLCVRKLMLSNLWLLEFVFFAQAEHPHYLAHYWKLL